MNSVSKLYTTLTYIQVYITFASLSVSSLGVVIKHTSLVYFWYLALCGIVMIMTTSFVMAIMLLLDRGIKYLRRTLGIRAKPAVGIG